MRALAFNFPMAATLALSSFSALAQDRVVAAGSTFAAPLYQKWIASFTKTHPGAAIEYQATGSAEGLRRLEHGQIDFAASDILPGVDETNRNKFALFPVGVGAIVPAYNLPGVLKEIRFTPEILADIYLGQIRNWNDPLIEAANHGLKLPSKQIVVIHRSDGSGTTYVWSDYLSKTSAHWRSKMGTGGSLAWPVGEGAPGNGGVAEAVTRTAYSFGYVEYIFAIERRLSFGTVRNAAGKYVRADIDSITASAEARGSDDLKTSLTNPADAKAYPIASFTWLIVSRSLSGAKRDHVLAFLDWVLSAGQRQAAALGYIALPEYVAAQERKTVVQMSADRKR
ncbi:MAG: phosphate ABC transporter substrate-binding protein PstS [Bryobacteraceae bacterium]